MNLKVEQYCWIPLEKEKETNNLDISPFQQSWNEPFAFPGKSIYPLLDA